MSEFCPRKVHDTSHAQVLEDVRLPSGNQLTVTWYPQTDADPESHAHLEYFWKPTGSDLKTVVDVLTALRPRFGVDPMETVTIVRPE